MSEQAPFNVIFGDFSGGLNEYDPPISVPQDMVTLAENVEFFRSPCGERRAGGSVVTITGSGLENKTHMSFLGRYLPSADETAAELIAFAHTPDATPGVLARKTTAWSAITVADAIDVTSPRGFQLAGASFNRKFFLAYKSTVDRLHVWDGTTFRRVGLAAPTAAPTAVDTGGGSFTGTRYYRVREAVLSGSTVLRRSEPSSVLTKAPSGAGTGLVVTKPADMGENATHWELEASTDNANFYRIATTVVGTTTVTDSTAFTTGYNTAANFLSATSGDYTPPISPKFITADNDRLLFIGSWENAAYASRVSWSVVSGDTTGVGNDERVPIFTVNFLDLDSAEGGEFTGSSNAINGYVYVAKMDHLYRLTRRGQISRAYEAFAVSKTIGALPGSMVEGVDEDGNSCLYFLDRNVGPCRVDENGLRHAGTDVQTTWGTVNINATSVVTRVLFYPFKHQVKWWIAVDGGNTPTKQIVLQTNKMRQSELGLRRGWSTATGDASKALCATLFASNIEANAARNITLKPLIGLGGAAASIMLLDTGTTDAGVVYRGKLKTRAIAVADALNWFGVMAAAIVAKASTGVTLYLKALADFGLISLTKSNSLTAAGSETHVVKQYDSLSLSHLQTVQFQLGDDPADAATPAGDWEVNRLIIKARAEETA